MDLPFPELGNLGEVALALQGVSMWQKERAARQILQPGFLDKLLSIFHVRLSRPWAWSPVHPGE